MFFYGYHYYMKKHAIIDDIPNIPSDDEDETMLGEEVEQGEGAEQGESSTMGEDFVATDDDALKIPW